MLYFLEELRAVIPDEQAAEVEPVCATRRDRGARMHPGSADGGGPPTSRLIFQIRLEEADPEGADDPRYC